MAVKMVKEGIFPIHVHFPTMIKQAYSLLFPLGQEGLRGLSTRNWMKSWALGTLTGLKRLFIQKPKEGL